MGARTVAGEMLMAPIERLVGTGFSNGASPVGAPAPHEPAELSQNLRMSARKASLSG